VKTSLNHVIVSQLGDDLQAHSPGSIALCSCVLLSILPGRSSGRCARGFAVQRNVADRSEDLLEVRMSVKRHRLDTMFRRRGAEDSALCGWDDPVPSTVSAATLAPAPAVSHEIECEVQRRLLDEPGFRFSSLVIRRVNDGVCIQGVLETERDAPDLTRLARQVNGVKRVIDQVVVRHVASSSNVGLC
jgi:hypothetical protein